MGLDEGLTDGQSEASATRTLLAAMPRPVETLEHMWQLIGSDTRPIVRNRYDNYIVPPPGGNAHFALTIRQRVGNQVAERDLYARAVHVDQRQVIGDMQR